ncbi:ectonucleotide pyrophosphatase/phosphodiesterase [Thalassotalea atypica]|uniref:alkaline phosphatase family protein n=1 Tax=Thalassotalea atypica TaxID=2054316 RepID=UPI0025733776|nr:ectonucleotide pyrophosphatase/phosphodiesterase [Thalassotalea atypica]
MNKFLFVFSCIFCVNVEASSAPVVVLSIDGFSAEYIERYQPKHLLDIKNQGLSSPALAPVFPTKTFPNHLTMVTGKYPSQHGIIHNSFYDRVKQKKYKVGDGRKDSSWLKAEPIWITAEKNGITSASYFWPESEATINNFKPTYRYAYDEAITSKERLNQIIRWLQMPTDTKPYFIASYFSLVDNAGHRFGPNSIQVKKAVAQIDQLIGEFTQQLAQLDIEVNLVIVSDHGMINIGQDNAILLTDLPLSSALDLVHNGESQLYIYEQNKSLVNETVIALNSSSKNRYQAYANGQFPKHWHFNQLDDTMPDIIVNALPPYSFSYGGSGSTNKATHGYDPLSSKKLNGIFISQGPNIKPGRVSGFSNIYIHSFLCALLNLPTTEHSNTNPLLEYKVE